MFTTSTADCIEVPERQAQRLLGEWLALAGLGVEDFPIDRDAAALTLFGAGFDVDADKLADLGRRGQVPELAEWHGRDILAAASALEGRRDWRPDGPQRAKIHPQILALHDLLEAGEEGHAALRQTFQKLDLKLALILLCEAPVRELREKMLATVFALLAMEGVKP